MFEVFTFFLVLGIIRLLRRTDRHPQPPIRIDVFHHFPDGGERQPEIQPAAFSDNVVAFRKKTVK